MSGVARNANRHGHRHDARTVAQLERVAAHCRADALGHFGGSLERRVGQERDELVTRVPCRDIVPSKVMAEDFRNLDEYVIALEMPEGVVDQLEVVDVHDEKRKRLLRFARGLDRRRCGVDERAAQRQPRQLINTNGNLSSSRGGRRCSSTG
jgi:hypothetical protein